MTQLDAYLREVEKTFRNKFVRPDLMIDKYYCEGTSQDFMSMAILNFFLSAIKHAYELGRKSTPRL